MSSYGFQGKNTVYPSAANCPEDFLRLALEPFVNFEFPRRSDLEDAVRYRLQNIREAKDATPELKKLTRDYQHWTIVTAGLDRGWVDKGMATVDHHVVHYVIDPDDENPDDVDALDPPTDDEMAIAEAEIIANASRPVTVADILGMRDVGVVDSDHADRLIGQIRDQHDKLTDQLRQQQIECDRQDVPEQSSVLAAAVLDPTHPDYLLNQYVD